MTELRSKLSEPSFEQSLAEPSRIQSADGRHQYDAYSFNTGIDTRPLVIYLGLGTTALTSMGQTYLHEYATAIDRPILTLHPHTGRWKSLSERAETDIEALDTLNVDEFDIAGASAGALIRTSVAQQAGDRVRHLTTISSIGTRQGYLRNFMKLPQQMHDSAREAIAFRNNPDEQLSLKTVSSNFINPRQYGEMLQIIRWSTNASLANTIAGIHQNTKWTDIIGTNDSMSDYQDHLAIVRKRNEDSPHSSSIHLLGHESHMWSTKRQLLAQIVKASLRE